MKKAIGKILLSVLLLFILSTIIYTGCTKSKVNKETDKNTLASTSKSPDKKLHDVYKVNELIDLEGNVFTVTKVERTGENDYVNPKNGTEYILISIEIKNKEPYKISCNTNGFNILTSNGSAIKPTCVSINSNTNLEDNKSTIFGEVLGKLTFEVAQNDHNLILEYTPNFSSNKTVKVVLQ